jgi:catechol-2,3-dioxygenase
MRIHELRLPTTNLPAQLAFYRDVLSLPIVESTSEHFAVQAGATRLVFTTEGKAALVYHFAFNVPRNQFDSARAWIEARVPLIANANGEASWHFDGWNADLLYFYDPAGNLVEFIARQTLDADSPTPFSADDIQCVSEIGLAVDDVRATVADMSARLRIPVYDGAGSDTFSALGDEHGLLIVVRKGRAWFPTQDRLALEGDTHMVLAGEAAQVIAHGRYVIETRRSLIP